MIAKWMALAAALLTISAPCHAENEPPKIPGLAGLNYFEDTRDDRTKQRVTIPKRWKLVGVSSGEKANSNILWFQDTNGSIYLVQGYTTYGRFSTNGIIQRITAE